MKWPLSFALLGALLSTLNPQLSAAPLGTAFTYQGWLTEGGNPANGLYDLQFTLYDAVSSGSAVAGPRTNSPVGVTNGLFTTTLDFGLSVFAGDARWLDIAVRSNGAPGEFTLLSPRPPLTPAPYALYAPGAGTAGTATTATTATTAATAASVGAGAVGSAGLQTGAVDSSKIADGSITGSDLSPTVLSNTFWRLGGNAGTSPGTQFLGTTDNQPVEFKVNSQRAMRLQYGSNASFGESINLIGGCNENSIAGGTVGATIAGGGRPSRANSIGPDSDYSAIGGGRGNRIQTNATHATIAGGYGNTISTNSGYSVIGGGYNNSIAENSPTATVAGGAVNIIGADSSWSTIGGGGGNQIAADSYYSTIGGGYDNHVAEAATYAVIPGGYDNHVAAGAAHAFAAGRRAKANHPGVFVWADSTDAEWASTGTNQFLLRASGGVGIGTTAPESKLHLAGGQWNLDTTEGDFKIGTAAHRLKIGVAVGGLGAGSADIRVQGGVQALNLGTGNDKILRLINASVGVNRIPTTNALEVEGNASKTTAGGWLANSDARIKEDIQPVQRALETLRKVRLVRFRYTDQYRKEHPSVQDRQYVNVVAQEFAEVFPDHVQASGEKLADGNEILQVDTHPLVIYSAAAVQELNAKLEQKDTEITELKQRLGKLEELLSPGNGGAK